MTYSIRADTVTVCRWRRSKWRRRRVRKRWKGGKSLEEGLVAMVMVSKAALMHSKRKTPKCS